MTCSTIKNIAYAGAGGFMMGSAAAIGLMCTFTTKTVGPGLSMIPVTGLLFAGTSAVSCAVNEIFKKMGWDNHPKSRLTTAHIVVAIVLSSVAAATVSPAGLGISIAIIMTCASLGVNLLMKKLIKNSEVQKSG